MPAGGGLLQLVAQGKQDIFLTGNPQISFFKMVYRRHTNFAIESQSMYFDGTPNFGQKITCLIPRRGDLLGRIYLNVTLPPLYDQGGTLVSYCNSIGHALIREITIEVGEQQIDRQTGEWMEIWTDFTTPASQRDALNEMIGRQDGFMLPQIFAPTGGLNLQIPLQFWFNRNPGSYLPLLALQYHPIRINITFNPLQSLWYNLDTSTSYYTYGVQPATLSNVMLWGDYVYLDTEERRRFVANPQEYLIEQVQYTPSIAVATNQTTATIPVEFNNPIKEFFFVAQRDYVVQQHEYFNYSNLAYGERYVSPYRDPNTGIVYSYQPPLNTILSPGNPRTNLLASAVLQLDGYDRFQVRDADYFRLIQPYEHHTTTPNNLYIYNYSFSIKPEDIQPSGSMNASRIDSIVWQITMNQALNVNSDVNRGNCQIRVYATNYNVFRVINGFGGVLFTV
jgi:hypothetical protein